MSGVFLTIDPPAPSPLGECVLPPHQRRDDTHSPGCEGVQGNSSSSEDARHWIGLLQYYPSTQDTFFILYGMPGKDLRLQYIES